MQPEQFSVLLADANRQVQIADHLLTITYPMVKDPKLLLSVIEHCRRALEDSADAVLHYYVSKGKYEVPAFAKAAGKIDIVVAFTDFVKVRKPGIAAESDAIKLMHDFRATLQHHKEAPTTFRRDEKLVIASEGFEFIKEVTPEELKRGLHIVKQFVHAANQHVIVNS